jgi:adhesin/invasin
MPDLNGSLTLGQPAARPGVRPSVFIAVSVAALGLAACHDDSTTAPLTATSVTVLSGGTQSGTVGAALATPVLLQVKDQNGKVMAGVAVALTAGTASGTIPAAQLTTDANGQVTTTWTLGTVAGTDTLNVQAGSLSAVQVLATALPDVAANIMVTAGDQQTAAVGSALATPLTVKVVDQYGNAVPNVTVTFSDDASGSLAATTVTTDAFGIAVDSLTLGPNAGVDDVTASIDTATGTVTTTLHETAS